MIEAKLPLPPTPFPVKVVPPGGIRHYWFGAFRLAWKLAWASIRPTSPVKGLCQVLGLFIAGLALARLGLNPSFPNDVLSSIAGIVVAAVLGLLFALAWSILKAPIRIAEDQYNACLATLSEQHLIDICEVNEIRSQLESALLANDRLTREAMLMAPIEACAKRLRAARLVIGSTNIAYAEVLAASLPVGVHSLGTYEMALALAAIRPSFDTRSGNDAPMIAMVKTLESEGVLARTPPIDGKDLSVTPFGRSVIQWMHDNP